MRVPGLGVPPARPGAAPLPGHPAVAVGRTWSGGLFAHLTGVAVVGGPLRTSRASEIARVFRTSTPPHGALTGGALADGDGRVLGIITAAAIRGTTVVIPIDLTLEAARAVVAEAVRQGFIGISSTAVRPARQRHGRPEDFGLLVLGSSRAVRRCRRLLVGDIVVGFEGEAVQEPEHR